MSDGFYSKLHEAVGTSAGSVKSDNRFVPVVTMHFAKEESAIIDANNGIYDPDDGRWHSFTLSVRAARQLIHDLNECLDVAIENNRKMK